jgi:hypothetical protein
MPSREDGAPEPWSPVGGEKGPLGLRISVAYEGPARPESEGTNYVCQKGTIVSEDSDLEATGEGLGQLDESHSIGGMEDLLKATWRPQVFAAGGVIPTTSHLMAPTTLSWITAHTCWCSRSCPCLDTSVCSLTTTTVTWETASPAHSPSLWSTTRTVWC